MAQRPPDRNDRVMASVLDTFRLDGRVAVVTGASSGLGVGFAQALAQAGADVVLGARRADRLAETKAVVEAQGRRALAVPADVTDPDHCTALAEAATREFGQLDILVNNAGMATAIPATKETPEEFRAVIDINLNGCYWMAQACARVMAPGSAIVNISSVLALMSMGLPQAAYTASKLGLIGLTRDLAQQWGGRKGIRVNAIAPGYFVSEMTDQLKDDFVTDQVIPRTLFGRLGTQMELNSTLVFLASAASSYITGITVPVDGGMLTR